MFTTILAFLAPVFSWFKGIATRNKVLIIVCVIAAILLGVLDYQVIQKQKAIDKLQIANQNLLAVNDSIRVTYAKDKQVEYDKYSYIAKQASDLKGVNDSLLAKIKNTKGDVKSAIDVTTTITDSGKLVKDSTIDRTTKDSAGVVHVDADVSLSFRKNYSKGNFHTMSAVIHIKGVPDSLDVTGDLMRDQISMTLFTGIKKNPDGNYEIFARSGYPGATITSLEGAVIDKKIFQQEDKRRIFTLGFGLGYVPFLYDFGSHKQEIFPSKIGATLGVNVNISEIFRKK